MTRRFVPRRDARRGAGHRHFRAPLAAAALAAAALACTAVPARGASWVLQGATGTAWQARTRFVLSQEGHEDLSFRARYETRPFSSGAPYYSVRLGRWEGKAAWEIETHHHLVTLGDPPPEIGRFEITHGYNLNTLNRAWERAGLVWRLGAGLVITHPESEVRGRRYEGKGFAQGFSLSGVCAQAAVERRFRIRGPLLATLEVKLTAAWARVPVEGGDAEVPNLAAHALAGLAYVF